MGCAGRPGEFPSLNLVVVLVHMVMLVWGACVRTCVRACERVHGSIEKK